MHRRVEGAAAAEDRGGHPKDSDGDHSGVHSTHQWLFSLWNVTILVSQIGTLIPVSHGVHRRVAVLSLLRGGRFHPRRCLPQGCHGKLQPGAGNVSTRICRVLFACSVLGTIPFQLSTSAHVNLPYHHHPLSF